jgi:hypothetical protein
MKLMKLKLQGLSLARASSKTLEGALVIFSHCHNFFLIFKSKIF